MTISIQQFNMCMSDDETMEKEKASNFDACKLIYRCVELEVLNLLLAPYITQIIVIFE